MLLPVTNASEPRDTGLTHFDASGQAHMVDVAGKAETRRVAVAHGHIRMQPATLALIREGHAKKGDVLGIARIAAIQAAKRTADLIPLCHPLPLTRVAVSFALQPSRSRVRCTAQVETLGRTGVEMEALTAVQVGLLTIYDMCKAVDRGMVMGDVRVAHKAGGKTGDWSAPALQAAAVRVFVRDLPAARAFYAQALGLPLLHDGAAPGWCVFDGGGVQLIVEAVPAGAGPEDAALVGRLAALSLEVEDLASTHARLATAGVAFTDPPQAQPWGGLMATLQDPSGNTLHLVQYPD